MSRSFFFHLLLLTPVSLLGQLVSDPHLAYERLSWRVGLQEAQRITLLNPQAKLSVIEKSGAMRVRYGHFFYERKESLFDIPVLCLYAFTVKDSVLGYILVTQLEADQIPGSPRGDRDSLWNRFTLRYGPSYVESKKWPATQRQWVDNGTTIICTKVDGVARTLVLSLTPTKKK